MYIKNNYYHFIIHNKKQNKLKQEAFEDSKPLQLIMQISYNCPYPAVVKMPLLIPGPDS